LKLLIRKILILTGILLMIILLPAACSRKEKTDVTADTDVTQNASSEISGPAAGEASDSDITGGSDIQDTAGNSVAEEGASDPDAPDSDTAEDNLTADAPAGNTSSGDDISRDDPDKNSGNDAPVNPSDSNTGGGTSGTEAPDGGNKSNDGSGSKGDKDSSGGNENRDSGGNKNSGSGNNSSSGSNGNNNGSEGKETSSAKRIIAIDAGHQSKGNYEEEPIGPGAKTTKPKVSSGTQGAYTDVPEYKLTLVIAKKVKEELISRGYEVVMIRETNDVNLSNAERAEIANESGADAFIRIHADGSVNSEVHGASTLYPSKKNPYVSELSADSYDLAKAIVDALCDSTGARNRGATAHDDMSGINWSAVPVTIIEMGYMTNEKEDRLMQTEEYQDKIVQGICDGIDDYFD
jgi:N-acetylmuramoyl-L-alanine amidase